MGNRTRNDDSAFKLVEDALNRINNDDIDIAAHEKEIVIIKKNKEKHINDAYIVATNVFTKERIKEIHRRADNLRLPNFNEDEFLEIFSNKGNITLAHINVLIDLLKDIASAERLLKEQDKKEPNQFLVWLTDAFTKGGANYD